MRKSKKNLLFLIRAFNDLDHFAPIMLSALNTGRGVTFIFTGDWDGNHYLTSFLKEKGAKEIRLRWLGRYHFLFRPKINGKILLKLMDVIWGFTLSLLLLIFIRPSSVVVEWGGISGREMARYFLVSARVLGARIVSLPHGYHIWKTRLINELMVSLGENHRKFDFTERNRFTAVVAQSENIKQFFLNRKIQEDKLKVLGSARFCEDWAAFNLKLALDAFPGDVIPSSNLLILIFLGNWQYRVDKLACFEMVRGLATIPDINILIKGHSRGDEEGGLLSSEREEWLSEVVLYDSDNIPSNVLIHHADVVINYGSSIGIEAVVQRKPLCNPSFVTENETIFDGSGVTFDAQSIAELVRFVTNMLSNSKITTMTEDSRDRFLKEHVYANRDEMSVSKAYLDLISS
jgi:hypothetical protein